MSYAINFFWIGDRLGPVHAACVRSFVRHGHHAVMHGFQKPEDLPEGVEFFDANQFMKPTEIVRHKQSGSLSLASDIYRLRILREGLGTYVDCDVFCLKPFPEWDYIFGWDFEDMLNNAVMRFPKDSQLLKDMLALSEDPHLIPFWERPHRKRRWKLRKLLGFPRHVSEYPWGIIGPHAITNCVKRLGLENLAAPVDYFYPFFGLHRPLLYDAEIGLDELATHRSYCIHLCASGIKSADIVPGSPLDQIVKA